jgi:hypothetical protein
VAIYCPILLDDEFGLYVFKNTVHFGRYCRPFAEFPVNVEIGLKSSSKSIVKDLVAEFQTNPSEPRLVKFKEMTYTSRKEENRPHAVCTVQSFKNPFSGRRKSLFFILTQVS